MTDVEQVALFHQDSGAVNNKKRENGASKGSTRGFRRTKEQLTSKQQLNSTIKSVRDLLRKDAGLSGDTDRLPQLTWLLFLKNFDDLSTRRKKSRAKPMNLSSYIPIAGATGQLSRTGPSD
jgi:hypothetical protein